MTGHLWCWSDIVNPQLVKDAMADEKRRARRRKDLIANDPAVEKDDHRPVAA